MSSDKRNIESIYPLSPMQQGMLFHSLYAPESGVYFEQFSCVLHGNLNIRAFEQAWQQVVNRHAALRTSFVWKQLDKTLQVVQREVSVPMTQLDWSAYSPTEQKAKFNAWLQKERRQGFDLAKAPLMRLVLVKTDVNEFRFIWNHHHLLLDGWSLPLVLKEVLTSYEALAKGQGVRLTPPPQYKDYITWLGRQDDSAAETYWRRTLQGFTAPTPLVVDGLSAVADGQPEQYAESQIRLSEETTQALQNLARRHHLTLSTLVQGAWALLLNRYSAEEDIVFGSTVSGRSADLPDVEQMIGLFINTLPVRVSVTPETPVLDWLQKLQAQLVEMRQYEYSALPQIQGWSDVPRGQPLFESILIFENYPVDDALQMLQGSLSVTDVQAYEQTNYPLTIISAPADRLPLRISYDCRRFEGATIGRILGHLSTLLSGIAIDAAQPVAKLPLLTSTEERQLFYSWNETYRDLPLDQCAHEHFEIQAALHPDADALIYEDEKLTYAELNGRANQLACYLRKLNVGPDTIVGLIVEPSLEMIVGILGILKAGGAYLPIDPTYPAERLAYMLQDASPPVLLTVEKLNLLATGRADTTVVNLDSDWPSIALESSDNLLNQTNPQNLAYIIYTSGSTGQPKGTLLHHQGLCNFALAMAQDMELGPGNRVLQFSSISFDASVAEIFYTLLSGATLCLASRETVMSTADLTRLLQDQEITTVTLPPSIWQLLESTELPALQTAVSAGEACTPEIAGRWSQGRRFGNGYGPTEASIGATFYWTKNLAEGLKRVPIGRPIANTKLYILDNRGRPLPIGVPGELHIGGLGVARGYLNRPEMTAERFISLAVIDEQMAESGMANTVYRTGDLCRYLPDGNIEFLGRIDHQVKVRGFRIELGEIEAVLQQHENVRDTAVLAWDTESGSKQLVAYIVPKQDSAPNTSELRNYLKEYLPNHMVPAEFIALDSMPRLPNGKINRHALPVPDGSRPELIVSYAPPNNPIEEILAGIWGQVLNVNRVGIHDDFHELGGHSLLATQIISRIRRAFQVEMPLRELFEHPTVAELAKVVQSVALTQPEKADLPLEPVGREGELPLSFAQQRLWFLEQLEPGNLFYNLPTAVQLSGPLDSNALRQSINEIVKRHEVLRTIFVSKSGKPHQQIIPELTIALPIIDLQDLPRVEQEKEAQRIITAAARRPFDLAKGPLLRANLLKLDVDDHIAVITVHHIVSDGWSMGVFIQELAALYVAFSTGQHPSLPDQPLQYADYSHWQQSWLKGEVLEKQLSYWKKQLGDQPAMLDLPTDRPRPAVQSWHGATETFKLTSDLTQKLRDISRQEGVTLFMTLLAAYQVLLYRYTRQDDISVGTAVANRTRAELESLIGFFVNTLVMRTNLADKPSFQTLLLRVREVALGAYAHQDLPFEMLVDALQPERDLSHTPLFQVAFSLQNAPSKPLDIPGLSWETLPADSGTAKFDLMLEMVEYEDRLHGSLEFNTDLFDPETIQRLVGHWRTLLENIVVNPKQSIALIPILTEPERKQLLVDWNETAVPFPSETCIHHLFEDQVAQQPEVVALTFEDQQLTYDQLNRKANQLAHHLQKLGVGPEVLVGLAADRSLEMVIGILAVLKAGGAYIPLDPSYPPERLAYMLQDAGPSVLLTRQRIYESQLTGGDSKLNKVISDQTNIIMLDSDWPDIAQESDENPESHITADNLAYVIYTSGSTGKPKGTLLQHRGLCNLTDVQRRAFNIRPGKSRILQFSPISFDASVWEIFMALRNGATLCLASQETLASGPELVKLLKTQGVTNITIPPSVLAVIPEGELPQLETIIAAGEACSLDLVDRWKDGRTFFNAYGPTETTVCASMYSCDGTEPVNPPIGRPIDNFQLYILDADLQPVPIGVPGELLVGGVGLARGYLHQPELTAERFIKHPFPETSGTWKSGGSKEHAPLLYRTGDLVRYRPDGNIEFLGRIDHQVKVRGFRIELGEIESALEKHPALQKSAVLAHEDTPGNNRLVAYVVPTTSPGPTDGELRSFLRQSLPEFMIPSFFVTLDKMPLTPSGKIDRQSLPARDHIKFDTARAYVAPRDETEKRLVQIGLDLLGIERIGIHDNFFEIGGHSLLATQFISRLFDTFHVNLPVRALFETPTIAELAKRINEASKSNNGDVEKIEQLLTNIDELSEEEIHEILIRKKTMLLEGK